eukprot:6180226-Pleurochrysis_carterae.AAC.1
MTVTARNTGQAIFSCPEPVAVRAAFRTLLVAVRGHAGSGTESKPGHLVSQKLLGRRYDSCAITGLCALLGACRVTLQDTCKLCFKDTAVAWDGFEELHTLIVLCPIRHDKAVHDKSMTCGHTEESMLPFDFA